MAKQDGRRLFTTAIDIIQLYTAQVRSLQQLDVK